jgi:hypothetical protein
MQNRSYAKLTNAGKLTDELVAAGLAFNVRFFGVSTSGSTTIVYVADDFSPAEGTICDDTVTAHVPETLAEAKTTRKLWLQDSGDDLVEGQYPMGQQQQLQTLYADALRYRPNRVAYIQPWKTWLDLVSADVKAKQEDVDAATTIEQVNAIVLDEATLIAADPAKTVLGALAITDTLDLATFLNENAVVTDSLSGVAGPFYLMQELVNRREIFNDTENPLYHASVTPLIGAGGSVTNLNTIHGKLGWHNQQVLQATYARPLDMLIYYGWLNSFNSAQHGWSNEKVAQELAKYGVLIFGDGVQDPTHGDYANTQVIIPRIKALNPNALIFGYVTANQTLGNFQTKATQWNTLAVHGIFLDEAGYDYGKTRAEFNERVDYVHGLGTAKLAFANAWNTDHVLGTANDASYPNSTYNSGLVASKLTSSDWILLESLAVNTTAYSGNAGYAAKADWAARVTKMISLRATYGVNFAAVGIINDDNAGGQTLFNFAFISSLMASLEAHGTSHTSYGSGTATTKWWTRPSVADMGVVWSLSPSIQVDAGDADVYHRYVRQANLLTDFSTGAQVSSITKW